MMVQAGAGVALPPPSPPWRDCPGWCASPPHRVAGGVPDLLWRKDNANPAMPLLVEQAKGFDW